MPVGAPIPPSASCDLESHVPTKAAQEGEGPTGRSRLRQSKTQIDPGPWADPVHSPVDRQPRCSHAPPVHAQFSSSYRSTASSGTQSEGTEQCGAQIGG